MKKIICALASMCVLAILFACSSNATSDAKTNVLEESTITTTNVEEIATIVETKMSEETTKDIESAITDETTIAKETTEQNNNGEEKIMGKPIVEISIKNYGKIQLELEPEYAPITVENFLTLIKSGFYDGLTFHRIIKNFMMQGGDPEGTGIGGSKNNIKGEFKANGVNNPISHLRGVISMARRGDDNNSASSQFFIVHQDSTFLDGEYAAFGKVISGIDVVDKVCNTVKSEEGSGAVIGEKPVIEYIKVIE